MRLLLDTHILLWAAAEPDRIPPGARERLESGEHEVLFSAASIWELAIKVQVGRLAQNVVPAEVAAASAKMGFVELPVTSTHAAAVAELPLHHRDPFDRLLIAQARTEGAHLMTIDQMLGRYSDLVELIDT